MFLVEIRAAQIKSTLRTLQLTAAFAQLRRAIWTILTWVRLHSHAMTSVIRRWRSLLFAHVRRPYAARRLPASIVFDSLDFPALFAASLSAQKLLTSRKRGENLRRAIAHFLRRSAPAVSHEQPRAQPPPDFYIFPALRNSRPVRLPHNHCEVAQLHRHVA